MLGFQISRLRRGAALIAIAVIGLITIRGVSSDEYRPSGTGINGVILVRVPSTEVLGYSRLSLRDKSRRAPNLSRTVCIAAHSLLALQAAQFLLPFSSLLSPLGWPASLSSNSVVILLIAVQCMASTV